MSVDTHPTTIQPDVAAPATPSTGPVARVIAGSLAAGAATALVLTLVVFPGATESVITGSVLLAFGLGWAMIAAPLQPLHEPAAALGHRPRGRDDRHRRRLLVFTPENDALTRLNWVWPPAMLALAVWMFVQMRRSLTGRGRWLLTPVLVVLAVASLGATYENVALTRVQGTYPAPGKTYAVGDHRLHLDCHGHGGPTVVLFNGLGEFSASWARITDPVAATTRVCAYDRAGQGWSDDVDHPQDGVRPPRTCTPCWPRPASTARTSWSGTPSAAPTP